MNNEQLTDNKAESIQNFKSKLKPDFKYKWFTLYTRPRFEKRVEEELTINGYECYLPLHRAPRVWSDRVKLVDMPLFNSYIFVKCFERDIRSLNHIKGVVRVVFYDGKPAVIRQQDIDSIKEFIELAAGKVLCTGDNVEILTGSLKSKSGKIIKIKKKILLLHIDQLAATVSVSIEHVSPVKKVK